MFCFSKGHRFACTAISILFLRFYICYSANWYDFKRVLIFFIRDWFIIWLWHIHSERKIFYLAPRRFRFSHMDIIRSYNENTKEAIELCTPFEGECHGMFGRTVGRGLWCRLMFTGNTILDKAWLRDQCFVTMGFPNLVRLFVYIKRPTSIYHDTLLLQIFWNHVIPFTSVHFFGNVYPQLAWKWCIKQMRWFP